jgi:hypothetical protein
LKSQASQSQNGKIQLATKKRSIKADSAADALKQRFPEINSDEIDHLFDQPTQPMTAITVTQTYKPNF